MTKFYVDAQGRYLGGFDGAEPPDGAIEVAEPPQHGTDLWVGNAWQAPAPSRDALKAARQMQVDAIAVTVNGKVFDGDETSQERMARALRVSDITGQASCTWVLHDNTAVTVTRDELAQALSLAMQAQGAMWVIP